MPEADVVLRSNPEPGIGVITLNRPDRLNALTDGLIDALATALDAVDEDPDCEVVILTGAGRGFCAGFDLSSDVAGELAAGDRESPRSRLHGQSRWAGIPARIRSLRPPVIAAVNGAAAGGGLAIALAADLRVCSSTAKFVVANVRLGLSGGEMGIAYLLPRLVGTARAAELMLTGRPLLADAALQWGIVNRVTDPVLDGAFELAREVAANPRFGVEQTKELLQLGIDATSFAAATALENRTQVLASTGTEMAEAIAATRKRHLG
jgi:enoyl-CoA hydratase/carnithine racemase